MVSERGDEEHGAEGHNIQWILYKGPIMTGTMKFQRSYESASLEKPFIGSRAQVRDQDIIRGKAVAGDGDADGCIDVIRHFYVSAI